MGISLSLGDKYRGVSYTQMCILLTEKKKNFLQMAMAQRHLCSSWTGSLTPSSIDLQVGCALRALISAIVFPISPCFPLHYNLHSFNGMPLEGQPSHGSFPLPILPKRQNEIKQNITCLLQIYKIFWVRIHNYMVHNFHSLMNNERWDLVP
jgi:hypothetical protein